MALQNGGRPHEILVGAAGAAGDDALIHPELAVHDLLPQGGGLLLQLDQRAVDMLERLRITEIVLTDIDYYIQETYLVSDIAAMRQALALSGGEQLCLAGENAPLSVVSEDGVRRIISE